MKVYYIVMHMPSGNSYTMFHLGLFPWKSAAQDYIDNKVANPTAVTIGRKYSIEETFVNEPD